MNYVITIVLIMITFAIGLGLYIRYKLKEYCEILIEVSHGELGIRTKHYLIKAITHLEYILRKDKDKLNYLAILKDLYINELDFYKKLVMNESNKLSESEVNKLSLILQTKITSSQIIRF